MVKRFCQPLLPSEMSELSLYIHILGLASMRYHVLVECGREMGLAQDAVVIRICRTSLVRFSVGLFVYRILNKSGWE